MRLMWEQVELARVGLLERVMLYNERSPKLYPALVGREVNTRQAYEEIIQEGDFPMATLVDEGNPVSYTNFFTGNTKKFYPVMRVLGYQVSKQAKYTDLYNAVGKPSRKMQQGLQKTKEQKVANVFNNATSTSYTGPDGQPFASTTHPTRVGVSANRPSSDIALGYLNLAQALKEQMLVKSHEGDPNPIVTGYMLLVDPTNHDLAYRITEATRMQGNANNDPNIAGNTRNTNVGTYGVTSVHTNPYFTSTTAWGLLATGEDNPICLLNRIPLFTEMEYDQDMQKYKIVMGEEYETFWRDWRGFWFTPGA